MFDLPNNDEIAALTKTAYESGAIVSAVCHGIVGQIFYPLVKILLKILMLYSYCALLLVNSELHTLCIG